MTMRPRFTMRAPAATIRIDGEIEDGAATELAQVLTEAAGQPVVLVINSPGGLATEGAAMAAEIERHGSVAAYGQGIVASAATLPFTAARRRILHNQTAFMIHDPAAMMVGAADDMRKAAADLDVIGGIYADHYARITGLPAATVRAWMRDETWMTAKEALALKFCDEVETRSPQQEAAKADYTAFRNAPARLTAMATERGWTAPRASKETF